MARNPWEVLAEYEATPPSDTERRSELADEAEQAINAHEQNTTVEGQQ